ncbi:MAG: hypothetical protein ACREOY_07975 [Candidatus Dormibacteraceae bacterium]
MVRTGVTRYGWWIAARLGLCLAGIDDVEVNRVRFRRLRVAMPLVALALLLTVLGAGLTVKPSAEVQAASSGLPTKLHNWCYIAALAASALAIWILLYVRATVARAVADRDLDPLARRATLRNLIRSRDGGLPVRVRWDDGLWMWLTGSKEVLAPIERHVMTKSHKGIYRLTVALVYHPITQAKPSIRRYEAVTSSYNGTFAWVLGSFWHSGTNHNRANGFGVCDGWPSESGSVVPGGYWAWAVWQT